MPPGHLLARVLVGGRRRAAVALRRAALQAQRQASGGTDPFRGRWTWRLLLRGDHRERRSLWSRDFAKPEVAYCPNGSVGAHAKKQGNLSQQTSPSTVFLSWYPFWFLVGARAPLAGPDARLVGHARRRELICGPTVTTVRHHFIPILESRDRAS